MPSPHRRLRVRTARQDGETEAELLAIGWDSASPAGDRRARTRNGLVYLVLDPRTRHPAWIADEDIDWISEIAAGAAT